jgi:hypothetical protein
VVDEYREGTGDGCSKSSPIHPCAGVELAVPLPDMPLLNTASFGTPRMRIDGEIDTNLTGADRAVPGFSDRESTRNNAHLLEFQGNRARASWEYRCP